MREKSYLRFGILILFIFTFVMISSFLIKGPLTHVSNFHFSFISEGLTDKVSESLENKEGEYAIYIEDLADEENFSLRSHDNFPSASLYKLFLMAAVLKEVQEGNLNLDDTLSSTKEHLTEELGGVDYGYENAPERISFTLEEALQRVGRVSDNFSAIMLMDEIGTEKVQQMADSLEANDTKIKSPINTSSSDMGKFFKKLHRKEIVDVATSEKLIEFLSLNQLNNRIPALLPEGTKVIHKTGELPGIRHDAGLVYLPNGNAYVIVLMSQNLKYEDEGIENFAQISKDIYDYFVDKYKD